MTVLIKHNSLTPSALIHPYIKALLPLNITVGTITSHCTPPLATPEHFGCTLRKKGTKLYLLRYKWPSLGWYPEGYNVVPLVRGTTLYLLALYHLRGNFVPQGTFVRNEGKKVYLIKSILRLLSQPFLLFWWPCACMHAFKKK